MVVKGDSSFARPAIALHKQVMSASTELLEVVAMENIERAGDGTVGQVMIPVLPPELLLDWNQQVKRVRQLPHWRKWVHTPFWQERYQEEFRLPAARPGFLDSEATSNTATGPVDRPLEVEAWRLPGRDDGSEDEQHPPYEQEAQVVTGEVSANYTAGGDMLRRTTNAAGREARELSPIPNVPRDTSANAALDGATVVQGSPDRDSISTDGLNQLKRVWRTSFKVCSWISLKVRSLACE